MKKLVQMLLLAVILSVSANLIAAEKYAIVIGGEDASDGKYLKPGTMWNDTYLMWEELYQKGYKNENIFVLFRDGRDQYSWDFQHIARRYNPRELYPEIRKITDYAATKENLELVIEKLKTECTKDDFLLTYVNTHGGRLNNQFPKSTDWEEDYMSFIQLQDDATVHDTTFARLMNEIPTNKKAYMMQNCFSGGFVDDLEGPNAIVHTAVGMDIAISADDSTHTGKYIQYLENELNGDIISHHGEFNFHNFCALSGKTPKGDTDYDGEALQPELHHFKMYMNGN